MTPGQETGPTRSARAVSGMSWADYLDGLVSEHGTLTAVAYRLAERRAFLEDPESVERGLRRLRTKGTADGGVWGRRTLACFGLPAAVADRIRWMGQYHTRFTDLPASLCDELLRPWERPPIDESAARIWILLGRMNLALRRRADPQPLVFQAVLIEPRAEPLARAELALVQAFIDERRSPAKADRHLAVAKSTIATLEDSDDRACLFARLVDHQAYRLNKPRQGAPNHSAAVDLYETIPRDGPPFATCRRENGLGWSRLKLGDRDAAERHALASVEAAGDGGSLRMRAMALNLLAECRDAPEVRARALAIAQRLEDEALAVRFRLRMNRERGVD